jgi:hypothetical protein
LTRGAYAQMIQEVRQLPAESMVFFASMSRDAEGGSRLNPEVMVDLRSHFYYGAVQNRYSIAIFARRADEAQRGQAEKTTC